MSEEEDFTSLPLLERLQHKLWKARLSGYEELNKKIQTEDNVPSFTFDILKKVPSDSNLVSQEAGLVCLSSFFEEKPAEFLKLRNHILQPLIDKCLSSNRASTRQKTVNILLCLIDCDQPASVIEELLNGTKAKQPKLVIQCVFLLKEIVKLYGYPTVDFKPILKALPSLFGHPDNGVRAEVYQTAVEIFKWTGQPAFDTIFKNLKPLQVKELTDLFSKVDERPKQTRFLLSQKPSDVSNTENEINDGNEGNEEKVNISSLPDPLEMVEPQEILSKIPNKFFEQVASSSWKERKEALDELLKIIDYPKFVDGQYHSLVSALAKRISDVNILCVVSAANAIEKLAKGLRTQFLPYKNVVLPALIDRLKEKKPNVITALRDAIDSVSISIKNVSDILEDINNACSNKNPQIRSESVLVFQRFLQVLKTPPTKTEIKSICQLMVKNLDDSTPEVRDASMQILGLLMKISGEKSVLPFLEKVDSVKMSKITEVYESKENATCIQTTGGKVVPKKVEIEKENRPPTSSSSSLSKKKASSTSSLDKKPLVKKSSNSLINDVPVKKEVKESFSSSLSESDAILKFEEIFGSSNFEKLNDSVWKSRLEAIESVFQTLESEMNQELDKFQKFDQVLILTFKQRSIWKDSNFQVNMKFFAIAELLAKEKKFSKFSCSLIIPIFIEKIGDIKLRKPILDCLKAFIETFGLSFVFQLIYDPLKALKSPKNLTEILKAMKDFIYVYGVGDLNIKDLIDVTKIYLENSNAGVRAGAISILTVLLQYLGPSVINFLNDVPAAQKNLIESEFEKVSSAPPLQPSVVLATTSSSSSLDKLKSLDDLLPRADISAQITEETLNNIGNSNWKLRKEGLDAIVSIIESANKRISSNLGDLISILKARLNDNNKNLVIQTLDIFSLLAESVGSEFDKNIKIVASNVLSCLNDNKVQIRQSALKCLDSFVKISSFDFLLPYLVNSLQQDGINLRKDLLNWISEKVSTASNFDSRSLASAVNVCLLDKSIEVRKAAQSVSSLLSSENEPKSTSVLNEPVESVSTPLHGSPQSTPKSQRKIVSSQSSSSLSRNLSSKLAQAKKRPLTATKSKEVLPVTVEEFLLLSKDFKIKDKRVDQDRGLHKWVFDSVRKDLVDFLREQCEHNLSESIISLLFSEGHHKEKDYLNAISQLDDILSDLDSASKKYEIETEEIQNRFVANSDLILKYLSIRLFDTNTSILMKCLDLIEHFVSLLDSCSYYITDYEANCFLPYFINKIGDSKETIRTKVHNILKQFCRIFPASKLFSFLLNALGSKNARVRSESLDEMAYLIQNNGLTICNPAKSFPLISQQIADRDSTVRNAAITCVIQAYIIQGETIYKYLGKISEKDKSLLEERIKRSKITSSPSKKSLVEEPPSENIAGKTTNESMVNAVSETGVKKFSLNLEELNLPSLSESSSAPIHQTAIPITVPPKTPIPPNDYNSEYMMDFLLAQITSGDAFQSIEALKQLEKQIQTRPDIINEHLNSLVNAITLQVRLAFTSPSWSSSTDNTAMLRLCKYLVNTLVQLFSKADLALNLSRETMQPLLGELLARLVDPSLSKIAGEASHQLTRALNVLMLRIDFSTLLDHLDSGIENLYENSEQNPLQIKYTELVMKCLWKLTKSLGEIIRSNQIDVNDLLLDLHRFLTKTPPMEWKRRSSENLPLGDMPLRTIKTILHEIAVAVGPNVLNLMTTIESIEEPKKSMVYVYLNHMFGNSSQTTTPVKQHSSEVGVVAPTDLTEKEMKLALDSIFEKIQNEKLNKKGMDELESFKLKYPHSEAMINAKWNLIKQESSEVEPVQTGNSARPSSGDTENYKERLFKLQQMFGYKSEDPSTPVSDPTETNPAEPSPKVERKPEGRLSGELPSVLALKERLARMKSSMASLNND